MNKLEETKEKFYNNRVVVVILLATAITIGASQLFQAIGGSVDTFNSLTESAEDSTPTPFHKVLLGSVLNLEGQPLQDYELGIFPNNYSHLEQEQDQFVLTYTTPVDSLYIEISSTRYSTADFRLSMEPAPGDTIYRQFLLKKIPQKAPASSRTTPTQPVTSKVNPTNASSVDLSNATVNGPIINNPTGDIVIESNYGKVSTDTTTSNN